MTTVPPTAAILAAADRGTQELPRNNQYEHALQHPPTAPLHTRPWLATTSKRKVRLRSQYPQMHLSEELFEVSSGTPDQLRRLRRKPERS